ncbi:MAG TPA: hypothetical protein VGQ11_02365 [Candidatus Acidoferrales bacterium]|jgi:hypothetical protein|nr:hypothetical protein [Candidatus Acidoferrales bacterium]
MSGNRQRGAGKIKSIISLLIIAAIFYTLFQVAPAYMNNYWIQDAMVNEARTAVVNRKTEDEIREVIWKVVKENEPKAVPPIRRDDIRVEYSGRAVNISLKYSVPVSLFVYQFTLNFNPNAGDRPLT